MSIGKCSIKFQPSEFDSLHELLVEKVIGATYKLGITKMLIGKILAEIETDEFMPYTHLKWD